jgi:hypothetical protein
MDTLKQSYTSKVLDTRWVDFDTKYSINDVYKELIQLIDLFKNLPKILVDLNK